MTVALSMLTLAPGGMGGSETYARELIRELGRRDLDVRAVVSPVARGFSHGIPEQVVGDLSKAAGESSRRRAMLTAVLHRRRLTRWVAWADVVHYPFTVPVPKPAKGQRSVVTLHDLQHHDLPHLFSRAERAYRSLAYDRAAKQANAVITISDFCRQRMVRHLGLDPGRVHVAHLGVRAEEFQPRLSGREEFLLYPAKGWPHKNHTVLFAAFRTLRRRHPTLGLILTGVTAGELPSLPDGVQALGLVPRTELIDLYGRAAALVFPSRYEGFGLPPIEAMSSGCPVAASSSGALPEVVGDAGVLFDPDDPDDVVRGVEQTLDTTADLQQRGLERAARFTWSACADVHEKLYRSLDG
jgi:glycosyltransferase involved in cell wall biosynthesis